MNLTILPEEMKRLEEAYMADTHVPGALLMEHAAQGVCDALVDSGVLAIWNFAPVHLNTPEGILVQNENMAASLALLSKHLSERLGYQHKD